MLTRAIEYDVLPTCLRHGIGVLSYSPLAGGWFVQMAVAFAVHHPAVTSAPGPGGLVPSNRTIAIPRDGDRRLVRARGTRSGRGGK
jgi:hypothetical protein